MATGHAVTALLLATKFFCDANDIVSELKPIIVAGFRWLNANKNDDGGWGVEPEGGADGKRSRMIGTCYTLRAYFADAKSIEDSPSVIEGIRWIKSVQQKDGGFSFETSLGSDACNTARAIIALLRSRNNEPTDKLIKGGIGFILKSRPRKMLWALDTEQYVTEGAPGTTIFNSNTTFDVLEALLRAGLFNQDIEDLLDWYTAKELEDGGWHLGANDNLIKDVLTWSTNEGVLPKHGTFYDGTAALNTSPA